MNSSEEAPRQLKPLLSASFNFALQTCIHVKLGRKQDASFRGLLDFNFRLSHQDLYLLMIDVLCRLVEVEKSDNGGQFMVAPQLKIV